MSISEKSAFVINAFDGKNVIKKSTIAHLFQFKNKGSNRCIAWESLPEDLEIEKLCTFLKKLDVNGKIDGRTHNGSFHVYIDFLIHTYGMELDSNGFPLFNETLKYDDLSEESWFIWRWIKLYEEIYEKNGMKTHEVELQKKVENGIPKSYNYRLDLFFPGILYIGCEVNEKHHSEILIKDKDFDKGALMKLCGISLHTFSTSSAGIKGKMPFEEKHRILRDNPAIKENLHNLQVLIETRAFSLSDAFRRNYITNVTQQRIKEKYDSLVQECERLKTKSKSDSNPRLMKRLEKISEDKENYELLLDNENDPLIDQLFDFRKRTKINVRIITFGELRRILRMDKHDPVLQDLKDHISVWLNIKVTNDNTIVLNWLELIELLYNEITGSNFIINLALREYYQSIEIIYNDYFINYENLNSKHKTNVGIFNEYIEKFVLRYDKYIKPIFTSKLEKKMNLSIKKNNHHARSQLNKVDRQAREREEYYKEKLENHKKGIVMLENQLKQKDKQIKNYKMQFKNKLHDFLILRETHNNLVDLYENLKYNQTVKKPSMNGFGLDRNIGTFEEICSNLTEENILEDLEESFSEGTEENSDEESDLEIAELTDEN